jgi:mannosyltransferase
VHTGEVRQLRRITKQNQGPGDVPDIARLDQATGTGQARPIDEARRLSTGRDSAPAADAPAGPEAGPALDTVPEGGRNRAALAWRIAPAVLPGLIMLVVGWYRINDPSLGRDEAATLSVARRTLGQIFNLAGNVDGSITPSYIFMHFWVGIFGTSEFALRAPSLIATAIGVGLVAELGRRLFNPTVGLLGGVVLAAIPAMARYAQEARVYGITFMLVALSTLLLYRAIERPGWRRWCAYAVMVLLIGLAQLLALSMLAGHAFVVLNRWRQGRDRALLRWLPVTAVALVGVIPIVLLGLGQRSQQLDWIPRANLNTVRAAPTDLFLAASLAWLLIGLGVLARWKDGRPLAELAVMAVVPPAALLAESFVTSPLWVARYVLFALFPVALLVALALHRYTWRALAVLAAIVVIAWPSQMTVRSADSHQGPDVRYVASLISQRQNGTDGIIYGGPNSWALRVGINYYLSGRPAPKDLLLYRGAATIGELADKECPNTAACIGQTPRIWLVEQNAVQDPLSQASKVAKILRADYQQLQVWRVNKGTIALYKYKA